MSELSIVIGLRAKAGKEEELRRDLTAVVVSSRTDEGSIAYDLFVDQSDPGFFVFVEHWASRELRDKHDTENPQVQDFKARGVVNLDNVEFSHFLNRVA